MTYSQNGEHAEVQIGGTERANIAHRDPNRVTVNGMVTTRAAAEAAGLVPDGEDEEPRQPRSAQQASVKAAGSGPEELAKDAGRDDDAATPAEIKAADEVLGRAAEAHGVDAVHAHVWNAAEAGEVPTVLPDGVSAADAQAVWDGYHATAEKALGEVGSSVAVLSEMLSEQDLKEARIATFTNDRGWLQDLGRKALSKLEVLPSRHPERFQELVAEMPLEQRNMIRERNGQWVLALPSGEMSWGHAVRRGIIKF